MKKNRKGLPYKGKLVREMPRVICRECRHYGCTDGIETQCMGFEEAEIITKIFRKLIKLITGN